MPVTSLIHTTYTTHARHRTCTSCTPPRTHLTLHILSLLSFACAVLCCTVLRFLACSYLQENLITRIENTSGLTSLCTLNLSQNLITELCCTPLLLALPALHTL